MDLRHLRQSGRRHAGLGRGEGDTSDGFDRGGWLVPHADEDMGRVAEGWFAQADATLLGRTTFQAMYSNWSAVTDLQNRVRRP